jgi:hypothetical protein
MGNSINSFTSSNNNSKLLKRSASLSISPSITLTNNNDLRKSRLKSYNSNTFDLNFITVSF